MKQTSRHCQLYKLYDTLQVCIHRAYIYNLQCYKVRETLFYRTGGNGTECSVTLFSGTEQFQQLLYQLLCFEYSKWIFSRSPLGLGKWLGQTAVLNREQQPKISVSCVGQVIALLHYKPDDPVLEENLSTRKMCPGAHFPRKSCPTGQDILSAPGPGVHLVIHVLPCDFV